MTEQSKPGKLGLSGVQAPEEDSHARAARRVAELEAHWGGDDYDSVDKFYIDPRIIPDGWGYEWKTLTVLGAENPGYQVSIAQSGWEPVPASRHPEMMPTGYTGGTIDRDGMRLFERPSVIIEKAKARELRKARQQVSQKEEQITGAPAGQNSPFGKHPQTGIRRSYEAIPIPK